MRFLRLKTNKKGHFQLFDSNYLKKEIGVNLLSHTNLLYEQICLTISVNDRKNSRLIIIIRNSLFLFLFTLILVKINDIQWNF